MTLLDPSSYSNPQHHLITHSHLTWSIDFTTSSITGSVTHSISILEPKSCLILDTNSLQIKSVSVDGEVVVFKIGEYTKSFGAALSIDLGQRSGKIELAVEYSTSPHDCGALQWLLPEQTVGKVHPYLFSQCQPIYARSLLPCQDTPSVRHTYTATVTAPTGLRALMSAICTSSQKNIFEFKQDIAVPSYLIAIAVGDIVGVKVGPRTTVWSEPAVVKEAAWEFAETEAFIQAGEALLTPYCWGIYDLLLLPASFPYGGMENPCLTFVTPTLLAGDRSLVDVVAHEIAHSWTGNLVGCSNWENFWLNEGWTVFIERKIISVGKGEAFRHFNSLVGLTHLKESVDHLTKNGTPLYTCLCPKLRGIDPDDVFSSVPYEKGFNLLFYLENILGGPNVFEPYVKAHIVKFSHKAINTDEFKDYLYEYFRGVDESFVKVLDSVDWNAWFHSPGMPPIDNNFDRSMVIVCEKLSQTWIENGDRSSSKEIFEKMDTNQRIMFFDMLLESPKKLSIETLRQMESMYVLSTIQNAEVKFKYHMLALSLSDVVIFPQVIGFLKSAGRMKYVRPLYRSLSECGEAGRRAAVQTFQENRSFYHPICSNMVAKDLGV